MQQLSHWRSCMFDGPRALCLFTNWATCLKRLRTPGLFGLPALNHGILSVMEKEHLFLFYYFEFGKSKWYNTTFAEAQHFLLYTTSQTLCNTPETVKYALLSFSVQSTLHDHILRLPCSGLSRVWGGGQKWWNLFYPLETKKTTIFAENWIENIRFQYPGGHGQ